MGDGGEDWRGEVTLRSIKWERKVFCYIAGSVRLPLAALRFLLSPPTLPARCCWRGMTNDSIQTPLVNSQREDSII